MEKKILLELFRFDVKTDYLPYFAKFETKIDPQKTLLELLNCVQNNFEDYGYNAYGFKINGIVVFDFDTKIEILLKEFGDAWKIEPLNPHLAIKDLNINVYPFLDKLKVLKDLGLDELIADEVEVFLKDSSFKTLDIKALNTQDLNDTFLLSFLPFAYATPLSVANSNYLGEAFFILVAAMYAKHKTTAILEIICDLENGILNAQSLQTYLFPKNDKFDLCIDALKEIMLDRCEDKKIQQFKTKILKRQ